MVVTLLATALSIACASPKGDDAPREPIPCKAMDGDERRLLDFDAAPLVDVARFVSCALERNLVFEPASVGAKTATFLGPRPLNRAGILEAWHALLTAHALTEQRRGAIFVIRPLGTRP